MATKLKLELPKASAVESAYSSREGSNTKLKLALPNESQNRGGLAGGLEYLGASAAAGVGGIFEGTFDLVAGTLAMLGGNKVYAENLFANNVVGEWHKNIADGYNPNKAMKFVGDVTSGLGQSSTMLIPYAGVPLFFAGVIGGGVGSAVEKTGELGFKEYAYGATTGVVEGLLERYLSSAGQVLDKVTKGATKNIVTKISSQIAKDWAASAAWKGVAKDMLSNAAGEFFEEAIAEAIDPVLQRGFRIDEDASTSMKEIIYAGLVGFGSGLLMGGVSTAISTGTAYKAGKRSIDNGNAELVVRDAHKIIDAFKIDKDSKGVAPYLTGLKSSLESYELATNKKSDAATIYLGQVQGYMSAVESAWAVQTEATKLAGVSESAAKSFAEYMSFADKVGDVSKNYTAEDWFADKKGIRTRYAAYKWAGVFLGDTVEMAESVAFDEAIRADREGRAMGTPVVQDIEGATFTGESGTYNVAPGEGQTSPEGDYLRVMKLGEDSYSIAQGNSSEQVRGYRALTKEQAQAEFERIKGAVIARRANTAQNQNLEAQAVTDNNVGGTARVTDGMYANIPTGQVSENPYTVQQMNAARRAVKNFDMQSADVKARVLRWMQSVEGKGIDADVVSGIANIIRLRPGLQVMLGETKEIVAGFHTPGVAGRNLIVLSEGKAVSLLRETIAHEVGHELEGEAGYEQIKEAALAATSEEQQKEWRELYKKDNPKMTDPELDAEIAAKALGRRLATPKFISRYSNKSTIRKVIEGAKTMLEYLRADEAGRLEIVETEKLIDMMNRAIQGVEVEETQKEVFNEVFEADEAAGNIPDNRVLRSTVKHSILEAPRLAEQTEKRNAKDGNVAPRTLKQGLETMKQMASLMRPYLSIEGILPPDVIAKTAWKNGSYGRTMENTTLCVRTLTYEYFKDEVAKAIGRPLTVAESLLASQKIYDIATYPQCIYCYVASDRKSYDAFIGEYMAAMDKYIKLLREGGNSDQLFREYLHGREPTNAQKDRWAEWKRIAKSGEDYIKASDVNTRSRRNALINKGGKFAAQVKDAQRYAQSASWAKSVSDYVSYGGDILKFSPKMVNMLNSEYGLRMYSFSDYTPAFIVENMQMVLDASVRGLKVLSYTKDADYVRIFGGSGMAINMSCFARYDSKTGTYVEDSRQGMKWDEVKQLRAEHKNAGAVMVVTDDNMLNWALDQDWIDVVIPYHIVKTGTTIAGEYGWRNYTRESADYAGNKTANIYPTEHNNNFEQFRKLVEERGITPRFNEWYVKAVNGEISGDKYMKLVNEVRVPAAQLTAVEPKFNLGAALDSFGINAEGKAILGGYVDKGGYMGNWFKAGVDVMQEVRTVSEDIKAGKTVSDVEYGRQSIREAGGVPKKRYNLTPEAAEQAAREAAEVEQFRNEQDREAARVRQAELEDDITSAAEKAVFEAEISRAETSAKDNNSLWFAWADVSREIGKMVKEYGITGASARQAAYVVHRAFNGFRAVTNYTERRQNMISSLVDYIIEVADAKEGSAGRWRDERREKLEKQLDEAYGALGKKTQRQKARERVEDADERARAAINGTAVATLLDRVRLRRFRTKTAGIINQQAFENLVSLARAIRPKYQVNLPNAEAFLTEFAVFARTYAKEAMNYAENPGSEDYRRIFNDAKGANPILNYVDRRLCSLLLEFEQREGGEWSDGDYETLKVALERLLAMDSRFDKQYNSDGTFGETADVADKVMSSLHKKYGGKVSGVNKGGAASFFQPLVYNSLEPEAAVRLMENAAGQHILSRMINTIKFAAEAAKTDERRWLKEIEDYKTKNKRWWKEWNEGDVVFEYTLPTMDGKVKTLRVTLTKDEAASLYMTSKRHQAKAALALGRVEIANAADRKGEQYRSRLIDGLTESQIDELLAMKKEAREDFVLKCSNAMDISIGKMLKQFSEQDRAYISMIEKFYATTSKQEKKKMDTRLFGSTNVFDGYYYPISRSSLNRDLDLSASFHDLDDVSTRGYTFNKSTIEGSKSRLTIRGATEVTSRHARQLAMYKHLTMPLQNMQRLYNYRADKTTAGTVTVRDYISKYAWDGFETYLSNYYQDVQGMSRRRANDAPSRFFRHLQSGYVKFQLGGNLKSMLKQFGSAVNMLSVADFDVWSQGLTRAKLFNKQALADMIKYSNVAGNRVDSNEVYYAAGAAGAVGKLSDLTMKHLSWADTKTNLILWSMAQYAVAKETGHAVGTAENKQLAGKKLNEYIMTVQDTSGAASKSAYARSPQVLVQGLTLFTSSPTKMFSRLYVASSEFFELKRMQRDGESLGDKERARLGELENAAKKTVGKMGGAILAAAVFESVINLLWGALRGNDDEEDEKKVQKVALEVVSNVVGIVPLAGTAAESLLSGYDVSNLYFDIYNDGLGALRNTYTMTANLAAGKQVSQRDIIKNLRSVSYFAGQVTGIPIRNINTMITMTLNTFAPSAAYEYDQLFYEPAYAADLKGAVESGNERLVSSIVDLTLKERTGAASSYAADEVVRLAMAGLSVMPRAVPTSSTVDGEEVELTRKQQATFRQLYSAADSAVVAVIATEQYAELSDELRAKAIKVAYDMYHSRAKSEVLGSELSVMGALSYLEGYIDVATLVTESAYIYGIKATTEATRAQQVKQYVSGYSPEAQAILLYAAGYRSEQVKQLLGEAVASLDEETQQKVKNVLKI